MNPPANTSCSIPASAGRLLALRHIENSVVAGDTLSKIATKFKTTVDLLLKANKLASANLIQVGQKLTIVVP